MFKKVNLQILVVMGILSGFSEYSPSFAVDCPHAGPCSPGDGPDHMKVGYCERYFGDKGVCMTVDGSCKYICSRKGG